MIVSTLGSRCILSLHLRRNDLSKIIKTFLNPIAINICQHQSTQYQHVATCSNTVINDLSIQLHLSKNLSLTVCSVKTVNTSNTVNTALTETWEFFWFMSTVSTLVNTASTCSNIQQHCHQYCFSCLKTCLSLSAASTQSTHATPSTQLSEKHGSFFNSRQHYQR